MRAQPYVDPARVLVAGQSRGGLLSVAYAGRHSGEVAGAMSFAGGWWSESWDENGFNERQAALAGAGTKAPMLWLYGDRDPHYGLPFVRRVFQALRDAGGTGTLVESDDLPAPTAARIVHVGQRVAKALKHIYGVPRVAFLFTGGDVVHAHAHVVPMYERTDITSRRYIAEQHLTFRPMPEVPAEELSGVAVSLRSAWHLR